jgi:hypothetical protein
MNPFRIIYVIITGFCLLSIGARGGTAETEYDEYEFQWFDSQQCSEVRAGLFRLTWVWMAAENSVVYYINERRMGVGMAGLDAVLRVLEDAPENSVLRIISDYTLSTNSRPSLTPTSLFETNEKLSERLRSLRTERFLKVEIGWRNFRDATPKPRNLDGTAGNVRSTSDMANFGEAMDEHRRRIKRAKGS